MYYKEGPQHVVAIVILASYPLIYPFVALQIPKNKIVRILFFSQLIILFALVLMRYNYYECMLINITTTYKSLHLFPTGHVSIEDHPLSSLK